MRLITTGGALKIVGPGPFLEPEVMRFTRTFVDQILASLELPLYRFLLRLSRDEHLAADLTQETLMRAWRRRHTLRETDRVRSWLFRIGINAWKDHTRARAKQPRQDDWFAQPGREPSPLQVASTNELGRAVWEAIDGLPERQKQVMHLRMVEQMEPHEIAETLGLDAGLVRSNLAAARKKLRQLFTDSTGAVISERES